MIAMRFLADTCINRNPAALVRTFLFISDADEQKSLSLLHLHEILLFQVEFWKAFDGGSRNNPFVACVDFAPH
jgi:hypothetical protein